ncbi:hypothetical protein A7D17_09585 [Xanthomonas floridensis]|uniref:Uncharacterized protein n=1 Tax=Xanthomonas floridensis TaxID=1843580 RepID=A0A1A9MF03_9XANT|nr:hypothetical protein A7D17_09585 [Xanthomonas floridensis]
MLRELLEITSFFKRPPFIHASDVSISKIYKNIVTFLEFKNRHFFRFISSFFPRSCNLSDKYWRGIVPP